MDETGKLLYNCDEWVKMLDIHPNIEGGSRMKKLLSLILALCMMLGCFGAFAEGESAGESADSAGEATTETTETVKGGGTRSVTEGLL